MAIQHGYVPVDYITVTDDFKTVMFNENNKMFFKGHLEIETFLKKHFKNSKVHSFKIVDDDTYKVFIEHETNYCISCYRDIVLHNNDYITIFNNDISINNNIYSLKSLVNQTLKNQKQKAVIKAIKNTKKQSKVTNVIIDDIVNHIRRGIIDIDVLFKRYVLTNKNEEKKFRDSTRCALEEEYPTLTPSEIDEYVDLLVKQTKK